MIKYQYLFKNIKNIAASICLIVFLASCEDDPTASLGDRIGDPGARPIIEAVTPAGKALNGVTEITIDGQNFTSIHDQVLVTFGNGNGAEIIEASPSRLIVKAPLVEIPSDSDGVFANIRVAVVGAELASELHTYRLLETVKELFVDPNIPLQYYGMCVDKNTNIFASAYNLSTKAYLGEYIISPGAAPALYNQKGFTHFGSLNFGPDGIILGARADRVFAIFEIKEGTNPDNPYLILQNQNAKVLTLDTDQQDRIWAGGEGGEIYSISHPSKDVTTFIHEGVVNALRVFEEGTQTYLYTSTARDSVEKIYRMQINTDGTLGDEEEYYDLSNNYVSGTRTIGINFTTDGSLYVGNNGLNPIIVIGPDKSFENLYPNLLQADIVNPNNPDQLISLAWGNEDDLYFVRRRDATFKDDIRPFQNIVRVLTGKLSAPYYGRE
jgi:hypothetical protein